MARRIHPRSYPLALLAGLFVFSTGVRAGQLPQAAEQAYKNIRALNGTPANQLNQAMHLMNAALNVTCEHCHIENQWDKDDVLPKAVARMMITMTRDLNARQFGGRQVVTCYTCHQGRRVPLDAPVFPVPEPQPTPNPSAAPALPSVDAILTRYIDALGGAAAIERVTSRVERGTQEVPTGPGGRVLMPATVERFAKAPNRYLAIYQTATFTVQEGFDGTRAWRRDANGRVTDLPVSEARRAANAAGLHEPLHLRQVYPTMTVTGVETVAGRRTYVVAAQAPDEPVVNLYFDAESGLLLRRRTTVPTPAGNSPHETAFGDYRDAGRGVKMPYTVAFSPAGVRTVLFPVATLRVNTVEENVAIDDARFAAPASSPAK